MSNKQRIQKADQVDDYMEKLEHPFKQEIERLRCIILNANTKLQERVKWNSPSFYYIKDLAAFNLRAKGYVQIIFIFYDGNMIEDPSLLQGSWKDRREARFYSMDDIKKKQVALGHFVNDWIKLIDNIVGSH
jgi:hypothetical protein